MKKPQRFSRAGLIDPSMKRVRTAAAACSVALALSVVAPVSGIGPNVPYANAADNDQPEPGADQVTVPASPAAARWPLPADTEVENTPLLKTGVSFVNYPAPDAIHYRVFFRSVTNPGLQWLYMHFDPALAPYIDHIDVVSNPQSAALNLAPQGYNRMFQKVEKDTLGHVTVVGEPNGLPDPYAGEDGVWRAILNQSSERIPAPFHKDDPAWRGALSGNWGVFPQLPTQNMQLTGDVKVYLTKPIEEIFKETGKRAFTVDGRIQENREFENQKVKVASESPWNGTYTPRPDEMIRCSTWPTKNTNWLSGGTTATLSRTKDDVMMGEDGKNVAGPSGAKVFRFKEFQPTSTSYNASAEHPFDYHFKMSPEIANAIAGDYIVVWEQYNGYSATEEATEKPVAIPKALIDEHGEITITSNPAYRDTPQVGFFYLPENEMTRVYQGNATFGVSSATVVDVPVDPSKLASGMAPGTRSEIGFQSCSSVTKQPRTRVLFSGGTASLGEIENFDSPATKHDADDADPKYTSTQAQVGEAKTSAAPTFTAEGDPNTPVAKPEGVTFKKGENAPDGVSVNPDTGEVTYTPTAADKDKTINIPVTVTYKDGSTDQTTAPFVVGTPQNKKLGPDYDPTDATVGTAAESKAPVIKDNDGNGNPVTAPDGTTFELGKDAPATADVDRATGIVTYTPAPKDANKTIDIPVVVTYPDKTTDNTVAPFVVKPKKKLAERLEPKYDTTNAVVGTPKASKKPKFTDDKGNPVPTPVNVKFTKAPGTPNNAKVNPKTGIVTYTPKAGDAGKTINVPVQVVYPDGSKEIVRAPFAVTAKPTTASTVDPSYDPTTATPGEKASSKAPSFTNDKGEPANAPAGTKFVLGPNAPEGAKVDPATGVVTYTPTDDDANKTVNIPVVATYPDGSTDTADAPFKVGPKKEAPKTNTQLEPSYDGKDAVVGTPTTSAPVVKDSAGKPATVPAGTKFVLGPNAPKGAKVDPTTGVVTFTPQPGDEGKNVTVPVVVTYPDGSTDTADAPFKVAKTADSVDPSYGSTTVKAGESKTSAAPVFKDKNNNTVGTPEGAVFTRGAGAPEGASVDPKTGKVTYAPAEDAPKGTVQVPVVVTYKDGSSDTVDAPFKVVPADAKPSTADSVEPKYDTTPAKPGEESTSTKPSFTNDKGEKVDAPEGATYELGDGAPEGAKVDPATGAVTYKPSAKDANKTIDIPVKVTYKDGSTDDVKAPFKVGPSAAEELTPKYDNTPGTVGKEAKSPAPTFTDKDGKPAKAPAGTKYELGPDAPKGAKIDPNTGVVTYTPQPGDEGKTVKVPVVVTYPDGSTDKADVPFVVGKKIADTIEPKYDNTPAKPGESATSKPPTFTDNDGNVVDAPAGTKYELGPDAPKGAKIDPNTGVVTYTPQPGDEGKTVKVPVVVTYPDGSTDKADVPFVVAGDSGAKPHDAVPPADGSSIDTVFKDGSSEAILPAALGVGAVAALLAAIVSTNGGSSVVGAVTAPPAPNPAVVKEPARPAEGVVTQLAVTGANSMGVLAGGLLAMVLGGLMLVGRRRRFNK